MKHLWIPATLLAPTTVLAHDGLHPHPHLDETSAWSVIIAVLVIATAALIVWARTK